MRSQHVEDIRVKIKTVLGKYLFPPWKSLVGETFVGGLKGRRIEEGETKRKKSFKFLSSSLVGNGKATLQYIIVDNLLINIAQRRS